MTVYIAHIASSLMRGHSLSSTPRLHDYLRFRQPLSLSCRRPEYNHERQHGVVFPEREDVSVPAVHSAGSRVLLSGGAGGGRKRAVQGREYLHILPTAEQFP